MALIKQSTTYTRTFLMVASAGPGAHITGKTGLSPTVTLSKAGGTFAAAGGTVNELANGWYKIALTTTDTNTLGDLAYHITAGATADPVDFADQIVAYDPFDAVRFGLSALPNAAAEAAGGLYTRGTGAGQINQPGNGRIDVNLVRWLDVAPNALISQRVDANAQVVADKTAYALSATGLDAISVADPGTVSSMTTLPKMIVAIWRWFFKKSDLEKLTATTGEIRTYADNGTDVNTTADVSDDGTTQIKDAAT